MFLVLETLQQIFLQSKNSGVGILFNETLLSINLSVRFLDVILSFLQPLTSKQKNEVYPKTS